MSHSDTINDMVIKDYFPFEELLSLYTGGKDNTLRLW
jgi:hypothetical protein